VKERLVTCNEEDTDTVVESYRQSCIKTFIDDRRSFVSRDHTWVNDVTVN